jgi:hypothetical protein
VSIDSSNIVVEIKEVKKLRPTLKLGKTIARYVKSDLDPEPPDFEPTPQREQWLVRDVLISPRLFKKNKNYAIVVTGVKDASGAPQQVTTPLVFRTFFR